MDHKSIILIRVQMPERNILWKNCNGKVKWSNGERYTAMLNKEVMTEVNYGSSLCL